MKPDNLMADTGPVSAAPTFLAGGGEMGALIRTHDWASTPLGLPESWPQSLKTAIRIMLTSRQPIWIGWGRDLVFFYNDPYKSIIGGKHPVALGQPTEVVWREIWHEIAPLLDSALTGGEGTFVEQKLLIMERNGFPEETYYTFSYSPIPDDDGSTGGIICANSDDTARVVGERQLTLLRELAASTPDAHTWREACSLATRALATNPHDIPFAMLYAAEPGGTQVSLVCTCGIANDHPAAPASMNAAKRRQRAAVAFRGSAAHAGARHRRRSPGAVRPWPADGRLGHRAATGRRAADPRCRRDRPRRRAGRGAEPVPFVRRQLSLVPQSRGRPDRRGDRLRACLRGRTAARGGARRDRPREDRVLFQRQPRVPYAAHADAWPARRTAREAGTRRRKRSRTDRGHASQWPAAAQARQRAARLFAHRSGPHADPEAADRHRRVHRRTRVAISLGDRGGGHAARDRRRACGRRRRPGSRDVGKGRDEPALERVQVHVRRDDRGRHDGHARRRRRSERDGYGHRHVRGRDAAALRALSPRGGREGPLGGRQRHRACDGAGTGAAARRHDRRGKQARPRLAVRGQAAAERAGCSPRPRRTRTRSRAGTRRPTSMPPCAGTRKTTVSRSRWRCRNPCRPKPRWRACWSSTTTPICATT